MKPSNHMLTAVETLFLATAAIKGLPSLDIAPLKLLSRFQPVVVGQRGMRRAPGNIDASRTELRRSLETVH